MIWERSIMPAKTNVKAAQNIELSLAQKVTLIIGLFFLDRVLHRVLPQQLKVGFKRRNLCDGFIK